MMTLALPVEERRDRRKNSHNQALSDYHRTLDEIKSRLLKEKEDDENDKTDEQRDDNPTDTRST